MTDIIGSKGGEKEHVHYEAPDSLHSTSYARVLDLVSEGEILGLAAGLQSVFLNGTPVQNADGTSNFQGVTLDFRLGTQTQDYIPGFPSVENELGVGVELKSGTPWVHAISNTALSAIRIILGVPALSQSDTKNGDIKGYKIDYKIELATDNGAFATVLNSSFNGKTTTAYQRSARIDLPRASTGWTARVTRLTANANTPAIADTMNVISYTDVIDAKLRYPMSAIVGVQVDAKQFQNVPTRAYDLMGRIVQVPSNYNAKTRYYAGNWDGTFKPSWTDNPAWIFRDLALNDRYGLGHRITPAQLDKWSLYAIARYCDGLVPDGKGGMEPRFTCNVYIQAQKQAYAVLQDLASVFRGISYWGAGSIVTSADMPTDPVYVYTAANVIGGKFARVGSSKKTRYTTALVSWNDPADMYKAKVEYVEDAEGITRYGIQQVSLTAFGCTSQGQAQRVGRWALATSRLETEMISFDVGMDGAIALPGQIIRVADPARMGRRNGGRIKTASGRVVVLDKAPTINAGDKLTVILPTGKSETRSVVSIAGDAVTVGADWSTAPLAQSVWSVDSTVLIAPMYKVRSVTEKDAVTYTISATQHEPGKFDFVELGTAITPRPETVLSVAVQQPPAAVTVAAYTVSLQDVQKLGFIASCEAVPGAVAYEGAFQIDNGNWFNLPRQPGPVFDQLDVLAGYFTVKIAAVNSIGITSLETVSAPTLVSKNANPKNAGIVLTPSASGFNVAADGTITPASITVHADLLDLEGIVSYSAVGATISSSNNNATIVATDMPGAAATITASITALGQTFTRSIDIVKSADGAAGVSSFTWIKYGTSAAGAGLTDNPAGMTYIGLAVNKSSATESTNAADYTWSLIKGSNGADGASTFTGVVYLQSAAAPATPTGGTFNFTTSVLTPPTGWSATQPASSTTPTWAVRYTFTAATIGATVTAGSWSAPVSVSQNGATGSQTMLAFLYQWGSAAPAAPTGTSTLNWVTGANLSYTGTDGWAISPPANPGTPGLRLYVATKPVTAAGGSTSTPGVSYSGATVSAWAQNGANGAQTATPTVYQWAATIPAAPSGAASHVWATGLFGAAPTNWALAPGAPIAGYTLWTAKVQLVDTSAAANTPFNWSTAAIAVQSYAGGNGTDGLSYVTAYVATTVGTASVAPAATTGKTSLPSANSSGLPGTPQAKVPTLTDGQYLMQFDGIYNPATNQVTWSIPYQSSAKFGSLSAITTNTGALTVTGPISSANGKFQVNADGAATMSALTVLSATDGSVILRSDASLARQTRANPNLCPTPMGMTWYNAVANRNGDNRFGDGQYAYIPTTPDARYAGVESQALFIGQAAYYIVSFDAYCEGNPRVLNVDVVNSIDYDSPGISVTLDNTMRSFSFAEKMIDNGNANACRLRMFTTASGGSPIVIANIKVELGDKVTPWCSSVITAANASTFIASAAIRLAHIDKASIGALSALSANIGLLRTADYGGRMEIESNVQRTYDESNNERMREGRLY
jgi:predicted phage tail protein